MNGEGMSSDSLKSLQRQYGAQFFWFRRDGKTYVVRDKAMLDRAWQAVQPQSELGAEQASIGAKQAEIGASQAEIGAAQAALALSRDSSRQSELGRQQTELGRAQSALGEKQAALGRAQAHAAKECEKKLVALADEAIRSGKAVAIR